MAGFLPLPPESTMLLGTPKQIPVGLLVLRVALGAFMLVHGFAKVANFSTLSEGFPDPIGMGSLLSLLSAIGAEVGCSFLLILGLGTRLVVLPLAFTMIIALFVIHGEDPWKVKELAALFLAGYAVIFITGPGTISLDQKLLGRSRPESD